MVSNKQTILNPKNILQEKIGSIEKSLEKGQNHLSENINSEMEDALHIAREIGDKNSEAMLYLLGAKYWRYLGQSEKSVDYNQLALQLSEEIGNNKITANAHYNLGVCYFDLNKLARALHHMQKAIAHDIYIGPILYGNLGLILFRLNKNSRALEYFYKSLEVASNPSSRFLSAIHLNIGAALRGLEKYDEAIENYRQSIQILGDKDSHFETDIGGRCLKNIGEIKMIQEKYDESLVYLNEAIAIFQTTHTSEEEMYCQTLIANVYMEQKEYDLASEILQKAFSIAVEKNYLLGKRSVLEFQIRCSKINGKFEDCIDYQNKMIELQSEYFYPEKKDKIEAILSNKEDKIDLLVAQKKEIQQQNQKLKQYNKELEQYAFIIAHDLKEPLCNISGFTSLLSERFSEHLDEEVMSYVQFIESGTQVMHNQLEDLLLYSTLRLEKDKVEPVNTSQIAQEVLTQLQNEIGVKEVKTHIEELPILHMQPKHIRWLFYQLLENVLKFKHTNRLCIIEINSLEKGGKTYIEIADNGIGVEEAYQQRIFRIFQRLDKTSQSGTGIGLSICKKIVELYNGVIELQSKAGEGTKVRFYLP